MTIADVPQGYQGAVSLDEDTAEGQLPVEERAKVPFAMTGYDFVPRERYYDRGFYELEKKHLWSTSWQIDRKSVV